MKRLVELFDEFFETHEEYSMDEVYEFCEQNGYKFETLRDNDIFRDAWDCWLGQKRLK